MKKEEVPRYIEQMEKKIAVLYEYNPNNIEISDEERKQIIEEQIKYETEELNRLNSIRKLDTSTKYTGYIKCKESKIQSLQKLASNIKRNPNQGNLDSNNQKKSDETETFEFPSDFELE